MRESFRWMLTAHPEEAHGCPYLVSRRRSIRLLPGGLDTGITHRDSTARSAFEMHNKGRALLGLLLAATGATLGSAQCTNNVGSAPLSSSEPWHGQWRGPQWSWDAPVYLPPVTTTVRTPLSVHAGVDIHPWGTLLGNSFWFYEAQQSGTLQSWNRAKRGHPGGFRDNSHTTDGSDVSPPINLDGGFHDAGDHVKYHLPFTAAFTALTIGANVHEQGYRAAGEWDNMARTIKWATDYGVRAHYKASDYPTDNQIVVQVGDTGTDHAYWGRPEQQTGYRPTKTTQSQNQGASDIMGGMAAVFAGGAMVFSKPGALQDSAYSAMLIKRARQLLAAADAKPGRWSDAAYSSSNDKDEIASGYVMVCWYDLLSKPSTLPASCSTAFSRYNAAFNEQQWSWNWDWDTQLMGTSVVLQLIAPLIKAAGGGSAASSALMNADTYASRTLNIWQTAGTCPSAAIGDGWWQVCYSPGGLAVLTKWGTLRHALNMAFASTLRADVLAANGDYTGARKQRCWARSQMLYAAGTNLERQSYIVGYTPAGTSPADRPHHRSASCDPDYSVSCTYAQLSAPGPNPSVLKGALVGGPNNLDQFDNSRADYVVNEVALDYNMGFTGTLSALTLLTSRLGVSGCSWSSYCGGGCEKGADGTQPLPSPAPQPSPAPSPSPKPSPKPSPTPSPKPSPVPSPKPSPVPSPKPSPVPSPKPSPVPSPRPSPVPSPKPTPVPSPVPSPQPLPVPSPQPAPQPSPSPAPSGTCEADVTPDKKYACDACYAAGATDAITQICLGCPPVAAVTGQEWACATVCAAPNIWTSATANACVSCVVLSGNAGLCQPCLTATTDSRMRTCFNCVATSPDSWACGECMKKDNPDQCLACVASKTVPAWQCTA